MIYDAYKFCKRITERIYSIATKIVSMQLAHFTVS